MTHTSPPVPKCGSSDQRNLEYQQNFSPKKFFDNLIASASPIIFDVGAHKGESVLFFRDIYKTAKIFSFEPEPSNFEALAIVSKQNDASAFNVAVGDADEVAFFYRQEISHLGGLLPINHGSTDSLGYAARAKNEKIEVKKIRLDTFCGENGVKHIDILKIDVQGFEVGVLKGAEKTLENTDCVTVEILLYDFYQSQGSPFLNVEQIMSNAGFILWDVSKISKNPKTLRTDWVEVVYRKAKPAQ
jgi:FkbM family methyltransferase